MSLSVTILRMRRVFKTRHFGRWMRKTELSDQVLCSAVDEMVSGLIDADLGRGVLKKRIALPGRGKRGGARTFVVTKKANKWFFVFGFEKNEKENISQAELDALQNLAVDLLACSDEQLDTAVEEGFLQEIVHDYPT